MKKVIGLCILCFLFLPRILIGQSQSINCIIFLNGKLPYKSEIEGGMVVKDSLNGERKIEFSYQIGEMHLSLSDKEALFSLPFEEEIELTIFHVDNQGRKSAYTTLIKAGWLKWSFIIFRVTTLKKEQYYFGVSGPSFSSEFIKREYEIFD